MKDDASDLRIAIGRVLERWQLERANLDPDSSEEQMEMLTRHIDDLKRAVTPACRGRGHDPGPCVREAREPVCRWCTRTIAASSLAIGGE